MGQSTFSRLSCIGRILIFGVASVSLVTGCVTYSHIEHEDRSALRKVSIGAAEHLPVVDIQGIPDDKSSTTTEGAVSGALLGGLFTWGIATAVCVGSMGTACVPAYGVAAGGTVAGGVIGGTAASSSATDTEGYEQQAAAAESQTQRLNIQRSLATSLDRAAREAGRVEIVPAGQSEVQVIAGVDQIIIDELGSLRIIGALELLGLDDTPQAHDFEFRFLDARKPADWVLDDGIAIDQALSRALPPIANRLVDEVAALDPDIPPLALAGEARKTAGTGRRWRVSWQTEDDLLVGTQIQIRLYETPSEPPCLDWLRRENYRDPSACLPQESTRVREFIRDASAGAADIETQSPGSHNWIARQVWQTADGQRVSEWIPGPPLLDSPTEISSGDSPNPATASIKVKAKLQFRVLWANRVDCWLYEPELTATHTAIRTTREREVIAGQQVIGGICSREHTDLLFNWGTPWTENEVSFWLEGDLQPDHRYRIKVAELKRNLNFRCVVLADRETDEELDRFCIPVPEDEQQQPEAR